MIAIVVIVRVSRAISIGRIRVWNSVVFDRRIRPDRFWIWLALLTLVGLSAFTVIVVSALSLFLRGLSEGSQRTLDIAGTCLAIISLFSFLMMSPLGHRAQGRGAADIRSWARALSSLALVLAATVGILLGAYFVLNLLDAGA
jgi:hypothetical protein